MHDLASELWAAAREGTLPARLTLDHVWLTARGRALLLDLPWPASATPAESFATDDLAGQQRFLHAVAEHVEATNLPLHARGVLQNLAQGKFEKLSFLAGTLRGLLNRPATLTRWVRTGALFMVPIFSLVMTLAGSHESREDLEPLFAGFFGSFTFFVVLMIVAGAAIVQLLLVPFRTTNGHSLFRLTVVDASGRLASRRRLLARWAIA